MPSQEDRRATERIVQAGKILGIGVGVLDHVIVGERDRFASMKEKGLIQERGSFGAVRYGAEIQHESRFDVGPKIGGDEPGEMLDVGCCHNEVASWQPEAKRLRAKYYVSVQCVLVGRCYTCVSGICPKLGGAQHMRSRDRQVGYRGFQDV